MMRTVDLVIAGDGSAARVAAADALQRGRRVLIVLSSGDPRAGQQLRRCLRQMAGGDVCRLEVATGREVVCVDGVNAVEAVVLRHNRTGRLSAVNACELLSFNASSRTCPGRVSCSRCRARSG
jgi:thioredoxin reductase